MTVILRDDAEGTHLLLTVTFPDQLADEEVRKLIEGGARDGWSATVDRVADSTAITTSHIHKFVSHDSLFPIPERNPNVP